MSAAPWVLDTGVVSGLMKGIPSIVERVAGLPKPDVLVPQPVLAEISNGIQRLWTSAHRDRLQARFQLVLGELHRAEWTDAVTLAYGELRAEIEQKGAPIPDWDVAVAAHTIAHDGTLVTLRAHRFVRIERLRIADWSGE